jgi:uncharacterized protein YlbG (UPF0298 family)
MASIPVFAVVIELPEIINPDSITVDKDHIYITDFPSVYIYSLKDYRLIKKFGRVGEGPKEWLKYALLSLHDNYLVISDQNKMLFFSKTGDYIKEIKARSTIYWGGDLQQTVSLPKDAPRNQISSTTPSGSMTKTWLEPKKFTGLPFSGNIKKAVIDVMPLKSAASNSRFTRIIF